MDIDKMTRNIRFQIYNKNLNKKELSEGCEQKAIYKATCETIDFSEKRRLGVENISFTKTF